MPIGCSSGIPAVGSPNAWYAASRPCSIDVAASAGKADHVADGVDVVDLGAELIVDEDPPAAVGF